MALAIGGCGSPSESDTTGQADLPAADLLPFPTAAPPNQRVALVSRFSEPDLEWGGRRSGEQATHVTMLSGGGEEPVFVSARPAAPDEYPELTDEPKDGTPALVVLHIHARAAGHHDRAGLRVLVQAVSYTHLTLPTSDLV